MCRRAARKSPKAGTWHRPRKNLLIKRHRISIPPKAAASEAVEWAGWAAANPCAGHKKTPARGGSFFIYVCVLWITDFQGSNISKFIKLASALVWARMILAIFKGTFGIGTLIPSTNSNSTIIHCFCVCYDGELKKGR